MPNMSNYSVKKADTLKSIAKKRGLISWKQIYDAPENKAFKKTNPNPDTISPGGKIYLPPSLKSIKSDYKKDMPRMSIEVDGKKALILVQQRWQYVYKVASGGTKWTSKEQTRFHDKADKAIWKKWSGKFLVQVLGSSDFARVFKDTTFKVNFDIEKVTSGGHWTVTVNKLKRGRFERSSVDWDKQTIALDTEDLKLAAKVSEEGRGLQKAITHEFGHAVGGHGNLDEYPPSSPHYSQVKSLMNLGSQLKKRHADHIMAELSKMIPDTKFAVKSVG